MNKPRILSFAAIAAAALFAAPVFAQGSAATLRVDIGSAMVSNGGEFVSAPSGTQVPAGSRVMLAEGSQATLVYPNGCTQPLSAAGVYGVPATCVAAAGSSAAGATGATGVDVGGLATVAGIAAAGAAALATMDDVEYVEPEPVSR
ncbi:hypothetical protein [Luteimonas sp. MC1750]|uniref:hypothetical protein n=1 Tax=Luteimonas sp. MC1750 TaxID=2799326 RepID=UPI0018F07AED|nr:hypothetical protein [Luteimonas sp. MC1750]MBJ6984228.1 hypothetical protein [Luteimonas sp. MC1750]QQO06985.1 hypothetical protein JGR68_06100 [Luteimonas sp. MC1750]